MIKEGIGERIRERIRMGIRVKDRIGIEYQVRIWDFLS